jgi:lysophospholipase L1-like esterase
MPAGVRLRFCSDTETLILKRQPDPDYPANDTPQYIDVVIDGELWQTRHFEQGHLYLSGLPSGDKTIELWLPQYGHLLVTGLELSRGTTLYGAPDPRPQWLAYGSSITQCRDAASPTRTWPALVAIRHHLNLTCLGFGGQCHLDIMMARLIRDTPAKLITLCVGINIYDPGSLNERTLSTQLTGFIRLIREKQPETSLVIISPIYGGIRETTPNQVGLTLQDIRQQLGETAQVLRQCDTNLYYIDGQTLLGHDNRQYLHDGLHPDAAGYAHLAKRFSAVMTPLLRTISGDFT